MKEDAEKNLGGVAIESPLPAQASGDYPVVPDHPFIPVRGVFADEPEESWNEFQKNIQQYRRGVDSAQRIKILARKSLKMSSGKLAAQAVHAALALAEVETLSSLMSVVVLEVNGKPFEDAKSAHECVAIVRDAGYTEVAAGTETCLAFLEDDPRTVNEPEREAETDQVA